LVEQKGLPHSKQAEAGVLGAILHQNEHAFTAMELVRDTDFFEPTNRLIAKEMFALATEGKPIDMTTVSAALDNKLPGFPAQRIAEYLSKLFVFVSDGNKIAQHAKIVRDKAVLRELAAVGLEINAMALSNPRIVEDCCVDAEKRINAVTDRQVSNGFPAIGALASDVGAAMKTRISISGVPSGFIDLDRVTAGWQPAEFSIIAARPSMGKTALAMNMAVHAAKEGRKVAFFTLEMSQEALVTRTIQSEAHVGSLDRSHVYDETECQLIDDAVQFVSLLPIYIEEGALNPVLMRAKLERLIHKVGDIDWVIVDYLQLMHTTARTSNRQEIVSDCARSLQLMSKSLKIPITALAQLNRNAEGRLPTLADLRESGEIEQAADLIAFIYRAEANDPERKNDNSVADIYFAKHKNGASTKVQLLFMPQYVRFENYARPEG